MTLKDDLQHVEDRTALERGIQNLSNSLHGLNESHEFYSQWYIMRALYRARLNKVLGRERPKLRLYQEPHEATEES